MKKISTKLTEEIIEELGRDEISTIIEYGFQLTAYEHDLDFDYEEFLVNQFNQKYEVETSDISEYAREELNDEFYENSPEMLNELFSTPADAISSVQFGDYHYYDDYIKLNGYGNLVSFNDPLDEYDEEAVIKYCIENMYYEDIDYLQENQELIEKVARELVQQGY